MKSQTLTVFLIDGNHSEEQKEREIRLSFNKKNVDITYQLHRKRRSIPQNRATFGIPYKMIAEALTEEWGEVVTVDQVHEMMKEKYRDILIEFSIEDIEKKFYNLNTKEHEYIYLTSTSKLSTTGMMKYYEALQQFGAQFLGIDIPSPNEKDYKDENKRVDLQ